ncbi:MAG: hypothetical protein WA364_21570, partial [Candidatus Nitrosopolaris sp.]
MDIKEKLPYRMHWVGCIITMLCAPFYVQPGSRGVGAMFLNLRMLSKGEFMNMMLCQCPSVLAKYLALSQDVLHGISKCRKMEATGISHRSHMRNNN